MSAPSPPDRASLPGFARNTSFPVPPRTRSSPSPSSMRSSSASPRSTPGVSVETNSQSSPPARLISNESTSAEQSTSRSIGTGGGGPGGGGCPGGGGGVWYSHPAPGRIGSPADDRPNTSPKSVKWICCGHGTWKGLKQPGPLTSRVSHWSPSPHISTPCPPHAPSPRERRRGRTRSERLRQPRSLTSTYPSNGRVVGGEVAPCCWIAPRRTGRCRPSDWHGVSRADQEHRDTPIGNG